MFVIVAGTGSYSDRHEAPVVVVADAERATALVAALKEVEREAYRADDLDDLATIRKGICTKMRALLPEGALDFIDNDRVPDWTVYEVPLLDT
jgi:hypothetical protein